MSLQQTRIVMIEKIEDYDRGSVNIINKAYHNNKNYIICSKIKQATSNG